MLFDSGKLYISFLLDKAIIQPWVMIIKQWKLTKMQIVNYLTRLGTTDAEITVRFCDNAGRSLEMNLQKL